jgi:hypothetical protein
VFSPTGSGGGATAGGTIGTSTASPGPDSSARAASDASVEAASDRDAEAAAEEGPADGGADTLEDRSSVGLPNTDGSAE